MFGLQRKVGSGSTFSREKPDPYPDPAGKREEILPDQEDGQCEDCDGSEANIFLNFKYLKEYAQTREFLVILDL